METKSRLISIYAHRPDARSFERLLRHLSNQGYKFINLNELLAWYSDQNAFAGEKLCFISLDDGFESNIHLTDACERYQAPLTVFVATRPLDVGSFWWRYVYQLTHDHKITGQAMQLPYQEFCKLVEEAENSCSLPRVAMTRQQVREFAAHPLVTIGSHTVTHTILPQMPEDVLNRELQQSKNQLEALTGQPCEAFSYPNGSLTQRDVEAVRRVYKIAFSVEQRKPRPDDDLMLVPRIGVTCSPLRDQLKICGLWPKLKKIYKLFN